MQQTLIHTLTTAIRDLLPVACDGVDARGADAQCDADAFAADDAQADIEHARQLLRAPDVLAALAIEDAQRLYAIRTTQAGYCAGSWAEAQQLQADIVEAARTIERRAIIESATPIHAMIDPVLTRFVSNGMAAQAAVDDIIGKVREDAAPYDVSEACEYCGAQPGEACMPDCLPASDFRAPDDQPWATREGLQARAQQLREGEAVFWGWMAVLMLLVLAGVMIANGGAL